MLDLIPIRFRRERNGSRKPNLEQLSNMVISRSHRFAVEVLFESGSKVFLSFGETVNEQFSSTICQS